MILSKVDHSVIHLRQYVLSLQIDTMAILVHMWSKHKHQAKDLHLIIITITMMILLVMITMMIMIMNITIDS